MSKRVYCPTCRNTVAKDFPHSCYDAAHAIAVQDAERAVVEAAEALEFSFRDPADPLGYEVDDKHDALLDAVRALRAARGEPSA